MDTCDKQLNCSHVDNSRDHPRHIEDAVDVNNLGWRQRHFETLVTSPQNPDFQLED